MGFFDKIKKAFMNEKETPPAEIKTDEELIETVPEEDAVANQVDQETLKQEQSASLETAEEAAAETELEPLIPNDPVSQTEELVEPEPEIIEEPEEELVVQEKYEKGLEKTRKTFGERLNELFANFRSVDEDFFEELEETLIGADVGFDTAIKITESLRQEVKLRNVKKPAAVQNTIIEKMVDLYEAEGIEENNALNIQENGLTVMLFVGVNGVGKTTSIGKLAHEFKQDGKKVLMAAADTFRAGAIDQLVVWGERAGVEVVRGKAGGDPAAVVFDAVERAKAEQADILMVDTAGRLQNKVNLMNELEKIKRIIQRELPDAPHEVLLVVDATTGQNAMSQAKQFKETTDVTGLVLTKLDGTAKGGIVLAIRNELHLPVKLVGLGEGIDDLEPFDANDFAIGLFKGLLKVED
ncbi:signal recognition particle-docking protein FtsY [Enterococcus moraviensis ATCC BAA-383]|uniref:Signal recognition particle receptor FtsY n=1 Tax=Enterococcus moraviensis ATCC BAA-383 TaxID=1158609 RepID=R2QGN3_9ENTE|nr:signal recognition particle-docking protein FtsY [Enterococcus moraviensis]EOH95702.1 signal recognition particle-docking protein FtsY [Enterococcus moraviensis ATCC BAA-383]EOT66189.1 signal recognition particle-docking protein FtsY [Enterococcus moraviensis ATCC BAA-383]OJG67746.1 signal recognition particle-docking protein FtsY [Enterococcus moraviensis]